MIYDICIYIYLYVCVRACVRACVRVCVCVTRHAKPGFCRQVDNSILLLIQLEEMKGFKMIPR